MIIEGPDGRDRSSHRGLDDHAMSDMTIEAVRTALARLERCDPECPGWAIIDSTYGTEIQRCDACCHGQGGGPDGRDLTDDDVAQLPEAQTALAAK